MIEFNNLNVNKFETLQKARHDLIGEIEAVIEYDNHAQNATDDLSRQTWINIKQEEITHIGELLGLINYIDPNQMKFVEDGLNEFEERKNKSLNQKNNNPNTTYNKTNNPHQNFNSENSTINKAHSKSYNGGFNFLSRLK